MTFRVGPGAREDVADIAEYIDSKTPGRGEEFVAAVEQAYATIQTQPRLQSPADDGPPGVETRQHLISGFRYRIVFVMVGDDITILAVAHVHRKPGHWHRRLTTDT